MIYNKSFTGGGTRQQAHALADDSAKDAHGQTRHCPDAHRLQVQATGIGAGEIVIADYDGFNATPVTKDNVICAAPSWSGRNSCSTCRTRLPANRTFSRTTSATGARKRVTTATGDNFTPASVAGWPAPRADSIQERQPESLRV